MSGCSDWKVRSDMGRKDESTVRYQWSVKPKTRSWESVFTTVLKIVLPEPLPIPRRIAPPHLSDSLNTIPTQTSRPCDENQCNVRILLRPLSPVVSGPMVNRRESKMGKLSYLRWPVPIECCTYVQKSVLYELIYDPYFPGNVRFSSDTLFTGLYGVRSSTYPLWTTTCTV